MAKKSISPKSFLEEMQDLIERTYDMNRSIVDIGGFVIGDEGYRRLVANRRVRRTIGSAVVGGPAVLIRRERGSLRASLYYPGWLVRRLEKYSPLRNLDQRNLGALVLFVEELDHLLLLADRTRCGRPVSLLEMEFHANVTKDLVVRFLLGRHRSRRKLNRRERVWLQGELYGGGRYSHLDVGIRERYQEAERLANIYMEFLDRLPLPARVPELRRFHRRGWQEHWEFLSRKAGSRGRSY
ncbi:MAG: hypothetical protein O6947_08525 [Acidobacteria bacterium]|nr:hypothetical protein [Acidobacteriota bacterium]